MKNEHKQKMAKRIELIRKNELVEIRFDEYVCACAVCICGYFLLTFFSFFCAAAQIVHVLVEFALCILFYFFFPFLFSCKQTNQDYNYYHYKLAALCWSQYSSLYTRFTAPSSAFYCVSPSLYLHVYLQNFCICV